MGLPGSGKSTILEQKYAEMKKIAVMVDPDAEKTKHPEFDPKKPELVHDWSQGEAKKTLQRGMGEGKDIIIDGTGTNLEKMIKYITDLQGSGYEVTLVYVKTSLKTALKRNKQRDRVVPENVIREKAEFIATSFEHLSSIVEKVKVHDNN